LLETPVLLEGFDGYREASAWRVNLGRFFAHAAGWVVQSGPGALRLAAGPAFFEGGRAFAGLKTARAAAMLAWVLWFHEYLGLRLGEPKQFSLSELAVSIEAQSGLSMTEYISRRALVQAVRSLEDLGAMRVLDADTDSWEGGSEDGGGGALLEFTAGAAYLISNPPRLEPSALQRAVRALLTGPAFHRASDPEAFAALERDAQHEGGLITELERVLDWFLELHTDSALLLRGGVPRGLASRWSPGRSVTEAAGLMLVNALRDEVQAGTLEPDGFGRVRLTRNRLYASLDAVRETNRAHWGEQGKLSASKLLREILEDWRVWGTATFEGGTPEGGLEGEFVTLEPSLARFEAFYLDPDRPALERAAGRKRRRRR
jgi:hypothetical protein